MKVYDKTFGSKPEKSKKVKKPTIAELAGF